MRPVRRILTLLIFSAPLVTLALLAFYIIRGSFHAAERDLAPILSSELSRVTGHDVRIGKVWLKGGDAYLENVSIDRKLPFGENRVRRIASARQVVVDFDLQSLLFERNPKIPLFANASVSDPVAYVARDRTGRWNFADLFKPRREKAARPSVGTVTVTNGRLDYFDSLAPKHKDRPPTPLASSFARVSGSFQFNADKAVTWSLSGNETTGLGKHGIVVGSYEPTGNRLYLRIDAEQVRGTTVNRLLPPGQQIAGGTATGRLTLVHAGEGPFEYLATARVADASATTDRLAGPILGVNGEVTASPSVIYANLTGTIAGSTVSIDGRAFGNVKPVLDGNAIGTGLQLQQVLAAFKLDRKYPEWKSVAATGSANVQLRGPLDRLTLSGAGDISVRGRLPRGVSLPKDTAFSVQFGGSREKPRIVASGHIPEVAYKNVTARDLVVAASYDGTQGTFDFHGKVAGGSASGRAFVKAIGKQFDYAANVHARGIDLSHARIKEMAGLKGQASADVSARGRTDGSAPQGSALVQVAGLEYKDWKVSDSSARLRIQGDTLFVDPLTASDVKGLAILQGKVDLKSKQVDLTAEADDVELARLPLEKNPEGKPYVDGLVFLRQGHVTGKYTDPNVTGLIRGYEIASGERMRVDFAAANLSGSKHEIHISNGQVWRFPEFTTIEGIIHEPFSPRGQMELAGAFDEIELQDIAELAGTEANASGIARGTWTAEGYLRRAVVHVPGIAITRPTFGDFAFDRVTGNIEYEAAGTPQLSVTEVVARNRSVTVTGSAQVFAGRTFTARGESHDVDLELLDPYLGGNANLTGRGDMQADISGIFKDSNLAELRGHAEGKTTGLTINREVFGDLGGKFFLDGDKIRASSILLGSESDGVSLDRLVYDRKSEEIDAHGKVSGLPLERLRQTLGKSGFVTNDPDGWLAIRLRPIESPFEGNIGGTFTVAGTREKPEFEFSWNGEKMVVARQSIEVFTGSARAGKDHVDLREAKVVAGPTIVTARGSFVTDKLLDGEVEVNSLSLAVLKRWFPDSSLLFKTSDLTRPGELAGRLRDARDPVTVFLRSKFSQRTIDRLNEFRVGTAPSSGLQQTLVEELNGVVRLGSVIYTPERFSGIPLSIETRTLISKNPTGRAIARLNHLLLTESYSRELRQGLPDRPMLEGLEGTAGKVTVKSSGNPSAPDLTVIADLSKASWKDPDGQVLNGRPIVFDRIVASPVTIGGGRIRASDITFTVADPSQARLAAAQPGPQTASAQTSGAKPVKKNEVSNPGLLATAPQFSPPGPYEAHLKDISLPFSWAALGLKVDEPAAFKLSIDNQGLGIISAFTSSAPRVVNGSLTADLQFSGPLRNLYSRENPDELAVEQRSSLQGSLSINAPRIRFSGANTEIRDLKAAAALTGDLVKITEFTARTQVVGPRVTSKPSEPISITGVLPIDGSSGTGEGLSIWAPKLLVGEAPIPGVGSGAFAAELSTHSQRSTTGSPLTVTGSLFRPAIKGTVFIGRSDLKLPDSFQSKKQVDIDLPFLPTFDLKFVAEDNVRVQTAQLNAFVKTPESAPIELAGPITDPRLNGTLVVDRGTLTFPTARFTIQKGGQVAIKYPSRPSGGLLEKELEIDVNMTASTRMTATSINGVRRRYNITVEAKGPINSPAAPTIGGTEGIRTASARGLKLAFRSDPPDLALSSDDLQRRVTGLLGGQGAIEELFSRNPNYGRVFGEQFTDILSANLLPELFDRSGIARVLGFDELAFEYSRLDAFSFRVSRPLFGPLSVSYWRRLSGANLAATPDYAAWEFKLSYRLRSNLQFSYSIDEQRTNAYLLEGVFRF